MSEWPAYRRVPRIRRLEYLVEFLNNAKQRYDHDTAKERILEITRNFIEERNKALGGKVTKRKFVKGEELVLNSKQLATQLQLVNGDNLSLTIDGMKMLELGLESLEIRRMLIERIWRTYPSFHEVLSKIREQNDGELVLPVERKKDVFSKAAKEQYSLTVDHWGFEVVRDWGTQLQILNWKLDVENKKQTVYLITVFAKLSEIGEIVGEANSFKDLCISACKKELEVSSSSSIENILSKAVKRDFAPIKVDQDYVFFRNFHVTEPDFEEAIWDEYMKLTNYRARFPILYPKLRDNVCRRLRISDKVFDRFALRMIGMRNKYITKIYPAGGTLPYHPGISRMLKNLPPKTGGGNFIVYLKLDR